MRVLATANVAVTQAMIALTGLTGADVAAPPPQDTSQDVSPLSLLLVVVLVAGIGYLLVQRGVLPAPPGPIRQFPEVDGSADNSAAIARLGGAVQYGQVDPATGQRSGVRATITPAMVAAAARCWSASAP
jgi:hypothetical protein